MGIFQESFVRSHVRFEEYPICVETGTNLGISTRIIAEHFPRVYTIEIQQQLHEHATRCFPDVTCILGDSVVELARLLPQLDAPTMSYLDAHWSGDHTVDWANSSFSGYGVDTGKRGEGTSPEEQVPLLDEIRLIVERFRIVVSFTVMIWTSLGVMVRDSRTRGL